MSGDVIGFSRDSDFDRMRRAIIKIENLPPFPQLPPDFRPYDPPGIWIYNTEEEEIPPYGVMAVEDFDSSYLDDFGDVFAKVGKPDTTLRKQYFVNDELAVDAGDIKFLKLEPRTRIAHDTSWSPATGESGGPKPDSWLLWKGYPSICSVIGRADTDNDILLGTLSPITTLLCKATAQNSAGSMATDTTDYKIYAGTAGSETDSGYTTVPAIYSRSDTMINEWFYATYRNGVWYAEMEDNSWLGKADSAISAGSSGTISLWTGTAGSETDSGSNATSIYNRTSVDIPSGGWVHIMRVNGKFYCEPWSC